MDEQGVVTIMHVDVEGSTALTTREGDELARRVLAHTKRLVREQAVHAGGREVDAVGDAMMLTFPSPRRGIAGAVDAQRTLAEHECAEPGSTLPVRIGLNVGEVLERDGTPFGAAVNAGARVMAKAAGGEILVSEMVRRLAGTIPGVSYRDRGRHDFKGFDEKWRLYEVVFDRPAPPAPPPRRRGRRRAPWIVAAVGAAVVVAAAGAIVATRGGGNEAERLHRNTVGLLDPQTGRVLEEVHVGSGPRAVAAAAGFVWVANYDDQTVTRVVEATGRPVTIPVGGHPIAIAADRGGAWVLELERRLVYVDRRFDRATIRTSASAERIAIGAGSLWTAADGTTVRRLDGRGRPVGDPIVPDAGTNDLAVSGGTVWACGSGLTPIDVRSGLAGQPVSLPVSLPGGCASVAAAGDAVWCLGSRFGRTRVIKVDAEDRSVVGSAEVDGNPTAIVAGTEAVWFVDAPHGTMTRVSPDLRDRRTTKVGATPTDVVVGRRGVWVAAS